jgi:metallo-beta-lactamase family protein
VGVHGGAGDALNFQCNADLHRPGAAGQVAVVVALAHAHPAAVCVKGGAGHQHQIQLLRLQKGRALQHRRMDAVLSHRPAVRARHGCGKGKALAAHRVGHRLALPCGLGSHGGKVIIPAFAVERTQEVLYCLHELNHRGKLPDMPIFVDSPLAIRATEVFRHHRELLDDDALALLNKGDDPFELPNLHYTLSREESEAINAYNNPAIVISASGMCNAGRIKHHLKHNVWRPGASIVFVGYQGVGTPGRSLVEGCKKITLFGEDMEVRAKIYSINSFSAHAGQTQLLDWLSPLAASKPQVVIVHGEEKAQQILSGLIKQRFGLETIIPAYLEEMTISGKTVEADQTHAELAQPKIDWQFLSDEVLRKWDLFQKKIANVNERPWVEQKSIEEALMKMEYYLTRLISKI